MATISAITNKGSSRVVRTIIPQRFQEVKGNLTLDSDILIAKNIFTTLGIHNNGPLFLREHLKRLRRGMEYMFSKRLDESLILKDLLELDLEGYQSLRITVYSNFYVFTLKEITPRDEVNLTLFREEKSKNLFPNDIKHGNYLYRLRELERAQENGFDDAVELDLKQNVLETSIRNLFFFHQDKLIIPKSELIFKGITLEILKYLFKYEEQEIRLSEIEQYDHCMTCNSVRGVQNVLNLGDVKFKINNKVKEFYEKYCKEKNYKMSTL